jgi:hypothetical protein
LAGAFGLWLGLKRETARKKYIHVSTASVMIQKKSTFDPGERREERRERHKKGTKKGTCKKST